VSQPSWTTSDDHTRVPEPPWDAWCVYANCWTCRCCGAAAGFGTHNVLCRFHPDKEKEEREP